MRFCCTFTLRAGFAKSVEAALQGEFDEDRKGFNSAQYRASGRMSKDGRKVRLAVRFEGGFQTVTPPPALAGPGAGATITNMSFDEMTNDLLEVRYSPKDRNFGDSIYFVPRRAEHVGTYKPGISATGIPTPLAPDGEGYGRPHLVRSRQPDTRVRVDTIDAEHIRVTSLTKKHFVDGDQEGDQEWERHVTLWTKPLVPVITRTEYRTTRKYASGGKNRDSAGVDYCLMDDFVVSPGGMVPKRVRLVRHAGGPVRLVEWVSEDLGRRDCTDENFTIHVAQTTDFAGLSRPIEAIRTRAVRLDDLKVEDLGDGIYGQTPVRARR